MSPSKKRITNSPTPSTSKRRKVTKSPSRVTNYLERMPLELFEPILEQLTFCDIVALAKYAPEGSRIASALEISPAWKEAYLSTYLPHKDDLHTLVSLKAQVGGQSYDIVDGLDLEASLFRGDNRLGSFWHEYIVHFKTQLSRKIQGWLGGLDSTTLTFVCQEIPFDAVGSIVPELKSFTNTAKGFLQNGEIRRYERAHQAIRLRFYETLALGCRCDRRDLQVVLMSKWESVSHSHGYEVTRMHCDLKHTDRPTSAWTVQQIKAFVDGYVAVQNKVNTTKAEQLRHLARLYSQHRNRLMPVNYGLDTIAQELPRVLDLYNGHNLAFLERRTHIFCHPYAYLIPNDWCLHLWEQVTKLQSWLVSGSPDSSGALSSGKLSMTPYSGLEDLESTINAIDAESVADPSYEILENIRVASKGIMQYYHPEMWYGNQRQSPADTWKPYIADEPRITVDGGTKGFAAHKEAIKCIWGRSSLVLPFDRREVEWIEAFVKSVKWMEGAFPHLAEQVQWDEEERMKQTPVDPLEC